MTQQTKSFFIVSVAVILTTMVLACTSAPLDFTNPKMWDKDPMHSWVSFDKNLKLAGFKMTGHGQMGKDPFYKNLEYYRYQSGDIKVSVTKSKSKEKIPDSVTPVEVNIPCAFAVEGKLGTDARQACLICYIANSLYFGGGSKRTDWLKNQLPKEITEFWDRQSKGGWQIWKTGSYSFVILKSPAKDHIMAEFFVGGFYGGSIGSSWAPLIDPPPAKPPDFFSADMWNGYPAVCFHRNIRQAGFEVSQRAIVYHHNAVFDICLYHKGDVGIRAMMSDGYVRAVKIRGMPDENFRQALLAGYTALSLLEFSNPDKRRQWFDFGLSQQFEKIWAQRRGRVDISSAPVVVVISPEGNGRIHALLDSRGWVNEAWGMRVP